MPKIDALKFLKNNEIKLTLYNRGERHLGLSLSPDRGFLRRLREYDPEITVWFNRVLQNWMLFRKGNVIMTVKNADGTFRELDEQIFVALRRGNWSVRGRAVFDEIERANLDAQMRLDADYRGFIKDQAEELRKHFRKARKADVGAINVPKEDLRIPDDPEVLKKRRQRRNSKLHVNYRRKRVAPMKVD